jgi:hypothetical protein
MAKSSAGRAPTCVDTYWPSQPTRPMPHRPSIHTNTTTSGRRGCCTQWCRRRTDRFPSTSTLHARLFQSHRRRWTHPWCPPCRPCACKPCASSRRYHRVRYGVWECADRNTHGFVVRGSFGGLKGYLLRGPSAHDDSAALPSAAVEDTTRH